MQRRNNPSASQIFPRVSQLTIHSLSYRNVRSGKPTTPSTTLLVMALIVLAAGCTRSPQTTKTVVVNKTQSEEPVSLVETFRRATDAEAGRSTIEQLNQYLSSHSEERPQPLTAEQERLLQREYALDPGELAEVQSPIFTMLDARHVALCTLLRDALRGLIAEDRTAPASSASQSSKQEQAKKQVATRLVRAQAGFNWVVRHVRLQDAEEEKLRSQVMKEPPGTAFPPEFVLRLGRGTPLERAMVFMAVLHQLGINGCMVAVPVPGARQMQYWTAGALIDDQVYLFDMRLGLPIPGPSPDEVATLAQIRGKPELLRQLTVDQNLPYEVSAEQVRNAEILIACSLSAMSPRMRYLDEAVGAVEGVRLSTNAIEVLQWYRKAVAFSLAGDQRINWASAALQPHILAVLSTLQNVTPTKEPRVRGWNQPGDVSTPIRAVRYFVSTAEGGVDPSGRRSRAITGLLIPWRYYPPELNALSGEPGQRLKSLFANPYPPFVLEAKMPQDVLRAWIPGAFDRSNPSVESQRSRDLIERARMPRDLILHGRVEEATNVLIVMRDELRKQRAIGGGPRLDTEAQRWCADAVEVYGTYLRLEQEARNPKSRYVVDQATIERARRMKDQLWSRAQPVVSLVQKASAEYMLCEVTLLIALCKQEQAERLQERLDQAKHPASALEQKAAKNTWRAAAGWWDSYWEEIQKAEQFLRETLQIDRRQQEVKAEFSSSQATVRRLKARALAALGEREQARILLQEASEGAAPFDRRASLYLAKRLQGR